MTDESGCAYCGHPRAHHTPGRCFTDVRGISGAWRDCTCTTYIDPDEHP